MAIQGLIDIVHAPYRRMDMNWVVEVICEWHDEIDNGRRSAAEGYATHSKRDQMNMTEVMWA
jgi:hypothetical protein